MPKLTHTHHTHLFFQWVIAILIFALGFLTATLLFSNSDSSFFQTNLFEDTSQKTTPHVDLSQLMP